MSDSILETVKEALNLPPDYEVFDGTILMHINGVIATLHQLGVGPAEGLSVEDSSTQWVTFLGSGSLLNSVKSYMYLRVRLLFDPPANSFLVKAIQDQLTQLEWRINVQREELLWAVTPPPSSDE